MADAFYGAQVEQAALALEVARRDSALAHYQELRSRYERRRLALLRRQLVMTAHRRTLALLEDASAAAGRHTEKISDTQSLQSSALIASLQLALERADGGPAQIRDRLRRLLSTVDVRAANNRPARAGSGSSSSSSTGYDASESPRRAAEGSRAEPMDLLPTAKSRANAAGLSDSPLRPLVFWATSRLAYRTFLFPALCGAASELARAKAALLLCPTISPANDDDDDNAGHSRRMESSQSLSDQQRAVQDARAGLARVTALQHSMKQRLYACHRWLTEASWRPSSASCENGTDGAAAAEMTAQIVRELRCGRVTLLRLLCESDDFDAF